MILSASCHFILSRNVTTASILLATVLGAYERVVEKTKIAALARPVMRLRKVRPFKQGS